MGKLQRPSQDAAIAQQGRRDHQACATTALQESIRMLLVLLRASIAQLDSITLLLDWTHAQRAPQASM
jgi:hypothetical protein